MSGPMINTLTNFGIPIGSGGRGGILMPKVKNRFRVTVIQFAGEPNPVQFTRQVISVSRPNLTFAPQAVHSYNSTAYYPGKAEWETVTVTVRDDITNSVAALVGAQTQRQMNFFEQTVPAASSEFKFSMKVETLDGLNDEIDRGLEEWIYEGCFLSAVNWESFDYSSSDAMTIEMTIRFDNATQQGGIMPATAPNLALGDNV